MKKLITIAAITILLGSCYNDKYDKLYPVPATSAVTCDTTAVSFKNDIVPILNTYCAIAGGCHSAADHAISNYDFSTYAGIQPVANTDVLINDINQTPSRGHNSMPLNAAKMPACDINKFTAWVNQGAQNN